MIKIVKVFNSTLNGHQSLRIDVENSDLDNVIRELEKIGYKIKLMSNRG